MQINGSKVKLIFIAPNTFPDVKAQVPEKLRQALATKPIRIQLLSHHVSVLYQDEIER